jgi:hypothetical protein
MALSDLPVFRELSEDQASYFDPHDPAVIATAISALLASPARQSEQRAYGGERISAYAFATLAEQLGDLHRRLATGKKRSTRTPVAEPVPHRVSEGRS